MSEVADATPAEAEKREDDIRDREAGWDDGGDVPEDEAPSENTDEPITRSAAPDGRIAGEIP